MIKLTTIAALATLATSSAVFAEGHSTARERAQSMAGALKENPGSARIASTLRPGTSNGDAYGTGGWGNIGSALVTETVPVSPANPKNVDLTPPLED